MNTLKVLRARPTLFFRLSGIRLVDFDKLVKDTHPLWLKSEHERLFRGNRKRAIGAGRKYELLYLMVDGTERPINRSRKPGKRKKNYSGKKKRHTAVHQIITDNNKRILAVGPAHKGSKHDKRIFDESRIVKPPDIMVLGDLGYLGTNFEIPIKKLYDANNIG